MRYDVYRMAATLDDLLDALGALHAETSSKATSIRLPEALHNAIQIATELGMDDSFTSATTHALTERVRDFARQQALAAHFAKYPEDVPSLADVAHRRVLGTDHPAASKPELVDTLASLVEQQWPDCVSSGHVDEAVDRVLQMVETLQLHENLKSRTA